MANITNTHELYGGKVKIDFHYSDVNPKRHHYTMHGKKDRIPGVTTALGIIDKSGVLINWAVKMHDQYLRDRIENGERIDGAMLDVAKKEWRRIRDEAADSGTKVHEWAEKYIKGEEPEMPEGIGSDQILNGISAFLTWVEEHDVEFISSERVVYSKKHKYVGTMDAEAIVDGKKRVIDFKTSKGVYPEMMLQTAAYQAAAEEEGSTYDGDRMIVRFDKVDGSFEVHEVGNYDHNFKTFLLALNLHRNMKEV